MNIAGRHLTHRVALALVLSAGLMLSMMEPAAAHKVEFRPVVSSNFYYQRMRHGQSFVFPRWLRKDRDFQRWFLRSEYRFLNGRIRGANWHHLYQQYRYETHYWRKRNKRMQGRVYLDPNRWPGHRHW